MNATHRLRESLWWACLFLVAWGLVSPLYAQQRLPRARFQPLNDSLAVTKHLEDLNAPFLHRIGTYETPAPHWVAAIGADRLYATVIVLRDSEDYEVWEHHDTYIYVLFHKISSDGKTYSWKVPVQDASYQTFLSMFNSDVWLANDVLYVFMHSYIMSHYVNKGDYHIYSIRNGDFKQVDIVPRYNKEFYGEKDEPLPFSTRLQHVTPSPEGIRFTLLVTEEKDEAFDVSEKEPRTFEEYYVLSPNTLHRIYRD